MDTGANSTPEDKEDNQAIRLPMITCTASPTIFSLNDGLLDLPYFHH